MILKTLTPLRSRLYDKVKYYMIEITIPTNHPTPISYCPPKGGGANYTYKRREINQMGEPACVDMRNPNYDLQEDHLFDIGGWDWED